MSAFEKWSLLLAGITASGVIIGLLASLFHFINKCKRSVKAIFSLTKFRENNHSVFITASLDLINQTELPVSITSIELQFKKYKAVGFHYEHTIPNLLLDVTTKHIHLSPYQSIGIEFINFECPIQNFSENAILRLVSTQKIFKCPISFQKCEPTSEQNLQ